MDCDMLIVGSGSGGLAAAKHASYLGANVVLVEKSDLGGACLNRGCIPTKTFLHATNLITIFNSAQRFGINNCTFDVNFHIMHQYKNTIVKQLRRNVENVLKKQNITFLRGQAQFVSNKFIQVETEDGNETLSFQNCILATGSSPVKFPIPGDEDGIVMTSDEILTHEEIPKHILIIGGSYIGIEFATIFANLGSNVTIVEILPHLLPKMDCEIADFIRRELEGSGINVITQAKLVELEKNDDEYFALVESESGKEKILTNNILLAVGRKPNVDDLGLNHAGIAFNCNGIQTDASQKTNIEGIYAIGDVTGGIFLAHVAQAQGIVSVDTALRSMSYQDLKTVPSCLFTDPEVASVGITEEKAKQDGFDYVVRRLPFKINSKAFALGANTGIVKILSEKRFGEILGAHIVGPRASDLIGEICLAMRSEATINELATTIHPHPTFSELIMETAQLEV